MFPEKSEHQVIQDLLVENKRLLGENNELLKKIKRNSAITMWLRIVWFFIIIGLPFILYFYIVEPYFDALGSSFTTFQAGLQEIPGWKQFYQAVRGEGVDGTE